MARVSTSARNAALAALGTLCDGGFVQVFQGIRPATLGGAGGLMLAEASLGIPAFASPVSGTMQANAISADASADQTGTASFFVLTDSSRVAVIDGLVGAELVMTSDQIVSGGEVSINSLAISLP